MGEKEMNRPGAERDTNKTTLRRSGDVTDWSSQGHIARLAFLLASVLIVLAAISLIFVGRIASREADRQALVSQQLLFETALENRFILIARDQLSLTRWDEAVRRVVQYVDEDFITDEFIDSLWFDFGLDRNILVGPDNNILADSMGETVKYNTGVMDASDSLFTFVQEARRQYFHNRIKLPGGYGQKLIFASATSEYLVKGYIKLGEFVYLVNAMPIVPDDGTAVLPDGNPVVLISALQLDSQLVEELNDQLAFSKMKFEREITDAESMNHHTILSTRGEVIGSFSWQSKLPGSHIWSTVIPVIGVLGSLLGAVAFVIAWRIGRLTVSLAQSEEQNRYLAMHDTLSGLANRLQFGRALAEKLEKLPKIPFTLVQCDLDKFKQVNDTLGHPAGDTVIKVVAQRLTEAVGKTGLVCRIGGDEFVLLLDIVDRTELEALAARIIEDICKPVDVEQGEQARVGVSMGVAVAPEHGKTDESLMAAADAALYEAKEKGRNRAVFAGDSSPEPG